MPVVDRQKEREIVKRARDRGWSDEQIKRAVLEFRKQAPPTPTAPPEPVKTAGEQVFDTDVEQLAIGAGKGLLSTTLKGAGLAERGIKAVGRFLTPKRFEKRLGFEKEEETSAQQLQRQIETKLGAKPGSLTETMNKMQEAGFLAEQIAEFFIPGTAALKVGKVAGAAVKGGRVARGLARVGTGAAAEAGLVGGQTALQRGEIDKEVGKAALVGAAIPAGLAGAGVGLRATGRGLGALKRGAGVALEAPGVRTVSGLAETTTRDVGTFLGRAPGRISENVARKKATQAVIESLPPQSRQAAKDGIAIRDIRIVESATGAERKIMREMIESADEFAVNRKAVDPAELVGRELQSRITMADKARKEIGERLGNAVKQFDTQEVDEVTSRVLSRLERSPGLEGIRIGDDGVLDFSQTVISGAGTKTDRNIIIQAFDDIAGRDASQLHKFRQELFESLGGKKRALIQYTDTQEKALQAIRSGIADTLEELSPEYRKINLEYRQVVEPLQRIRRFYKNLAPDVTEDILNQRGSILARRLTSNAPGGQEIADIIAQLERVLKGRGNEIGTSVETLQDFLNALNRYYDIAADTGLAGQVSLGLRGLRTTDLLGKAVEKVGEFAGASRAVQQKALKELLGDITTGVKKNSKINSVEFKNFERINLKTPELRANQEAAIEQYLGNKKELVEKYLADNGKIMNTDDARKLFDVYTGANSAAVHEPASKLVKDAYAIALKETDAPFVALTGGGSGAGKSAVSGKKLLADEQTGVIFDTTMASFDSTMNKIEQARKAGKKPSVFFTYRDPLLAWRSVVDRAGKTGRVVPLDQHFKSHLESATTLLKMSKKAKNVPIELKSNNGTLDEITDITLDKLNDFVVQNKRGVNQMKLKAEQYVKELEKQGKISKELAAGLLEK